jgi:hypothetical protein
MNEHDEKPNRSSVPLAININQRKNIVVSLFISLLQIPLILTAFKVSFLITGVSLVMILAACASLHLGLKGGRD